MIFELKGRAWDSGDRVWCEFQFQDTGVMLVRVDGEPEVVAASMAAWWASHGAAHIRAELARGAGSPKLTEPA